MEYLLFSAFCSVTIAHLLKMVVKSELRLAQVLMVNYFVATVAAAAQVSPETGWVSPFSSPDLWAVGFVTGFIFIGTFYLYGYCVNVNGVGLSLAAMRMSLAVPVLISVFYFNEQIRIRGVLGMALVFIALLLMIPKSTKKKSESDVQLKAKKVSAYQSGFLLFLLFALAGFGDTSLKLFERYYIEIAREEMFMSLVFLGAFFMSIAISLHAKTILPTAFELLFGVLIGIPNLYSSIFMINALTEMDASRAFALVNVSIVVLGALTGYLFWKDKMQTRQLVGLTFGIAASFFLAYA